MKVAIFGATGMIGSGALIEALAHPDVESVVVVARRESGVQHEKLTEVVHGDMFDLSPVKDQLAGLDACFWCLGVSATGMSEEDYDRITYQLTRAAVDQLLEINPDLRLCYISGDGAASSEESWMMWARVKGRIENYLLSLPLGAAYMFRPGFIQPVKGVRSRTRSYNALYALTAPLYPLLRRLAPKRLTNTEAVGLALIRAVTSGAPKPILGNQDINALAQEARSALA